MATTEHPTQILAPPGLTPERPVFVASSHRRARLLRRAGLAAAILAALWLAALGIGMLGLGRLPGVPLPPLGKLDRAKASPKVEPTNASIVQNANVVSARSRAAATSSLRVQARLRRGTSPSTGSAQRSATSAPTAPAAPQPAPLPKQTGWARRGSAAPPGQTRRAQPLAGQQQAPGQIKKTTTVPVPPPVPPGQLKPPKKG
jgi:hypothetical protein